MIKRIRSRGYYPYLTDADELSEINRRPEKVHEIFKQEVLKTRGRWLEIADAKLKGAGIRCYVAPGNDDMFEIDAMIAASNHVTLAWKARAVIGQRQKWYLEVEEVER